MGNVLRIGIYTSSLAHSHAKPPGVDVFVDRLAEQLARRGHRVTMFSYSPPASRRLYASVTIDPEATARSTLRRTFVAPVRLNTLDTSGLDVLHLHGDDWFFARRRVPTVRTFFGSALYEARLAARARRRASQYLIYGCELLASRLATRSYGIISDDGPGYRLHGRLPLGFDVPPDATVERSGPPTILFVGTWTGRKRGHLLHATFLREVVSRVPDARLVMVSDHCDPAPNVEWAVRPTDDELVQLYRSAWILCLPSSYEGFGLPYLEAMAHGTPVVATPNPGSEFLLDHGRGGIVVPDEQLGSRLAELLLDERRRRELANAGLRRAGDFTWSTVLDLHERAYADAIKAFGHGPQRVGREAVGGPVQATPPDGR